MDIPIEYTIRSGFEQMHFDEVTPMLANAYWTPGIGKPEIIRGAQHSALVTGAFDANNRQIGYARVVSDKTRFAYILDVVVHEQFRKQGIGQAMINFLLDCEELKDVYQWLLITSDAHGVYRKAGFVPLSRPGDWMEIRNPRPARDETWH
jgi:GNAT superfamily N-acetyltransferase